MAVDAVFYNTLWAVSASVPSLAPLHDEQPLFARTPLLLLMYLVWSLLYLALSRQQRLERAAAAQHALKLALKEAEVQRLLGQLSPHFIFNTINNIRALILKDGEAAQSALAKFAGTLRYQFADQNLPMVSLADELRTVHDYLDLVRLQLGGRLIYEEHIDPAALSLDVPRFSLQLLVENAIKHGLAPQPQPGILRIDALVLGNALQLDVRNSGRLGDRYASGGIGLSNLQERLQLLAAKASLSLTQDGDLVLARLLIEHCH